MRGITKEQAVKLLQRANKLSGLLDALNSDVCDALDAARAGESPLVDFLTGLNETLCAAAGALSRALPDEVEEDA